MAKRNFWFIVVAAIMMTVVSVSCTDEFKEAVKKLFGLSKELKHDINVVNDVKAVDYMDANIKITEDEQETNLPSSPAMEANIKLAKSSITLDKDAASALISVEADSIARTGKNWGTALSTTDNTVLEWYLAGGQTVTVPVNITALRTQYKGKYYNYGTDSLVGAKLTVQYRPVTTRSGVESTDKMNAEYVVDLTFKEVNHKDSTFTVQLRRNAVANVKADKNDSIFTENGHWRWVNDSTYNWDFEIVKIVNGDTTRIAKSIPANYWIKGIDPYEKIVKSFSYQFDASNGWNKGYGEAEVSSSLQHVTLYQKAVDHYGANIVNLDDNDKIVTDYTAVLQRVIYDDGEVRSVSDYPEVTAKEANTVVQMIAKSNKDGYNQANLINSVDFTILDHVQNVSEEVYLYVQKNILLKKEITDAKLEVTDDYIEASLKYKETYTNGDTLVYDEKRSFARVRKTLSDWMATEQYYSVMTDTAKVALTATEAKEDGYWSWTEETRDITTIAHLYASNQTNRWRETIANSITYTRDGISYEFGQLGYVAKEEGQKVKMVNDSEYNYSDSISINLSDNKVGMSAPGLIKITGKELKGYENRDKNIVVKSDSVIASVKHVTMYMDGSEDVDSVSHSFPRTRTAGEPWESYENNGDEQTADAVSVSLSSSEEVVEGEWSCVMQTRNLATTATLSTSTKKNTWTSTDPNKIKFIRNGITCAFDEIAFSATKNSSSSTLKNSGATEDTYTYSVGITETYGNENEIMGGSGTIIVKKGKSVTGHDVRNAKLVVSDDKVDVSLTFVDYWSDGSETTVDDQISVARTLEPTSNWSANSDYANILTGAAVVTLGKSSDVEDGYWKYTNQTRTITTPVTLSASTETNSWTSVDPNNFVYERDGLTHKFDVIEYNANESGSALGNLISDSDTESVYEYTGGISVTYGDNTKSSTAPGQVTVKKDVTYEVTNTKLTVNDDDVVAELDFITKINDKAVKTDHLEKSFSKSLVCTTDWSSKETSLSVMTGLSNVTLTSSDDMSDGDWSYVRENRTITTKATLADSEQTNSWTSVVPNKIVFSKNGVSHDFGTISFSATEAGQNYNLSSESANVATYDYTDKLNVTYGDNTVSSLAPGKIIVEYSVSGHEIRNQKLTVGDTGVTTSLTWVTKYGNGYEETESIEHFFELSIEKLTEWTSAEYNADCTTGAANVALESSNKETDGDWSCTREVRKVNTFATLNASNQENALRASMPNSITFSRNGETYTFDALSFTATEAGQSVAQTSEDMFDTFYGYSDNININFGGKDFANTLNGTITVEKPWVPDVSMSYGGFKSAVVTATPNEDRTSWVYVLSVHFENGIMPIKIERNATSIDLAAAEALYITDTRDEINSLVYTGGQWVNAIAQDNHGANCMVWRDVNGAAKRSLDYVSATAQGWNDGHNTVYADAVTFTVYRNVLYINKGNATIGTIKLNK